MIEETTRGGPRCVPRRCGWWEAVVAAPQACPVPVASLEHAALEVLLPGGAKLRLSHASQVPLAAQLLQALRLPC